jgi:hypothetical protein
MAVPVGTKSVSIKPRFYLRKKFTFDAATTGADEGVVVLSGAQFLGGDADSNNQVDGNDYAWLRTLWMSSGPPQYDINRDGKIDENDFPDLNGDGVINGQDYEILKGGWYNAGDPE